MITTKMENLRASTADSPPPFFASTDSIFDVFRPILETDLRRLLISCNLKSCELDPLPPFIIVDVVDDIAPFLLYFLTGLFLKASFLTHKNELLSFQLSRNLT